MLQPAYQLGPFIIKVSLVIIVLSITFSYLAIKFRLRNVSSSKVLIDGIFNSFIISIIVWKLSYIVINPIRTVENPMVILFFNGGSIGTILGVISFFVYLLYHARNQKIATSNYIDATLTAIIAYFLLSDLLYAIIYTEDRIMHFIGVLLAGVFLALLIKKSFPIENKTLLEFIIWWSISQVLLELFMETSLPFIGIFSTQQVIYITVSVIALGIQFKQRRSNN